MARYKPWAASLAIALVLTLALAATMDAQGVKQTFGWIIARTLTVETTSTLIGNVTTRADVAVGDDITVADDATIAGVVINTPGATQVIAQDTVINADYSYQPISSTGTVSTSVIATSTALAGQWLTLVNVANTSIVLTDTGVLKLSGNLTLGQYDSVRLVFDGTNWIQVSTSNN